jgi:hypothetical protein
VSNLGLPVKRIVPFSIVVTIESVPYSMGPTLHGYRHSATAIGTVNGIEVPVRVSSDLGWSNADYLSKVRFYLEVDGNALVPIIDKENRE